MRKTLEREEPPFGVGLTRQAATAALRRFPLQTSPNSPNFPQPGLLQSALE